MEFFLSEVLWKWLWPCSLAPYYGERFYTIFPNFFFSHTFIIFHHTKTSVITHDCPIKEKMKLAVILALALISGISTCGAAPTPAPTAESGADLGVLNGEAVTIFAQITLGMIGAAVGFTAGFKLAGKDSGADPLSLIFLVQSIAITARIKQVGARPLDY